MEQKGVKYHDIKPEFHQHAVMWCRPEKHVSGALNLAL